MAKKKFKDEAEEIKTRQGASDITEDIIQISDKFLKIAKLSDILWVKTITLIVLHKQTL